MSRRNDSELARHKLEQQQGRIRRHTPYRHQLMYEWPYVAGSTCLVVLLIWQPFQPPALAVMLPVSQPGAQTMQRSLQEIDANCYQVQSETLVEPLCPGCAQGEQSTANLDASSELSRSILTCQDIYPDLAHEVGNDIPGNMTIDVIKSNHSF